MVNEDLHVVVAEMINRIRRHDMMTYMTSTRRLMTTRDRLEALPVLRDCAIDGAEEVI